MSSLLRTINQNPLSMSALDTANLGLNPGWGNLRIDPASMSVSGSVNWVLILVAIIIFLVFCCSCMSFAYTFRNQIYTLIQPKNIKVEGYDYKGREIPDKYSGY
jgi:hypothetical protein